MLIDCTHCQARVNADVRKLAPYHSTEWWEDSYQLALLCCPQCQHPLVGQQLLARAEESEGDSDEWSNATRVWPEPFSELSISIPEAIRTCLLEAGKCLNATAYT